MQKTKLTWSVSNIKKMYEDAQKLSFDHPIQRKSEMWSNNQKSLLIHSMLANYPIPNIYVLREDSKEVDGKGKPIFNYFVMDGKQRLTCVISFMCGEFALDDDTPNIVFEGEEYEIGGKYYVDLDELIQREIAYYKFEIVAFEDCTNKEIEEIFYRLNNSTPLTKSQVAKSKMGLNVSIVVNRLLKTKFFATSCNFTKSQIKTNDDQKALLQGMILLDVKYEDFELNDFSENSILAYSANIHDTYSDKQVSLLESTIEFLSNAFPEKHKDLRKISIPILMYMGDIAQDNEVKPRYFRDWWNYFTSEDELFEVYKTFCSSGSTKREKILGRLAIMTKSFCAYFETSIPEELQALVKEVEEKLASKEESGDVLEDDVANPLLEENEEPPVLEECGENTHEDKEEEPLEHEDIDTSN